LGSATRVEPDDFLVALPSEDLARSDSSNLGIGDWRMRREQLGTQRGWACGGGLEIVDFNFAPLLAP